jgi:hypothetical protein
MAQMVDCLSSKHKALGSNLSYAKNKNHKGIVAVT